MPVVIVESPSKAKTINKYLGSDFVVLASYGHIRDLPSKDGSVDPESDFAMTWEADAKAKKVINEIAAAVKSSDKLILATDPDREGEAISWHLYEVLRDKKVLKDVDVTRVAFNAVTKSAILEAMQNAREIDQSLVDAYLARRALDYLVGFSLSPVLWRKLPGSRSAGRVQSVALRIICDREMEIEKFVPREYWSLEAMARSGDGPDFKTHLVRLDGEKVEKFTLGVEGDAKRAEAAVKSASFAVASVEAKPAKRNPPPPFTTSTLQQEAARKLGFNAQRTMRTAQRLYEGIDIGGETTGLITYMRTDGIDMAPEAVNGARAAIASQFGDRYRPEKARFYKSKQKNAQEAHECIRPTDFARAPKFVKGLDEDQFRLYELIWKRGIASQMESAQLERTTIELENEDKQIALRATGTVVLFDGFLTLYDEGRDDADDDAEGGRLPKVEVGARADVDAPVIEQHFTQPPPRYSEASLVKKLEELGIGRPSTYASILATLRDREYVRMDKNRFIPEDKGRIVTAFLENFFEKYVAYDFTAGLEEDLDVISDGKLDWRRFLAEFWKEFSASISDISELRITEVLDALNEALGPHIFPAKEDGSDPRACPSCENGQLSLKVGRYGAFIGCSNYPECNFTRQLAQPGGEDGKLANEGPKVLGVDPNSSLEVSLRTGRFGPYIQLGEQDPETKEKPKRSGIPKGWAVDDVDFDKAMMLLSLPREVGPHPEDGEMIEAGLGRYGPFVKHGKTYANLESVEEVFEIGLNRAVTVIAEKKANPRGRGRTAAKPKRELGKHPESEEVVGVFDGRYGPYVKHGKTNATIPKDISPDEITLEQALTLIAEREAKAGAKKPAKKAAKKTAAKKATKKAAKKTPAKKAAKKTAAKKSAKSPAQ